MFIRFVRNKQGGGKLFAFFTILFMSGAIWAYFLVYLPAVEEKSSQTSTIRQLIHDAEDCLEQGDYLNAFEAIKAARTVENLDSVYVARLEGLENQAMLQEFDSQLNEADELSDVNAFNESNDMLKSLKTKLENESDLKKVLGNVGLKKLEKLESRNRVKELEFLLEEIKNFVKRELFNDAEAKINEARTILKAAKSSDGFDKQAFLQKLNVLEHEKNQLSIEDTVGEIDLLAKHEVYLEAYEKIRAFDDVKMKDSLKQRVSELKTICEEKISVELIKKAENLADTGDYKKALEILKTCFADEFTNVDVRERLDKFAAEIKLNSASSSANSTIEEAKNQLAQKAYEEALKTLEKISTGSTLTEEQAQEIAKIESKAYLWLDFERIQNKVNSHFINGFVTLKISTTSGEEQFGLMRMNSYQLLKSALKDSSDENAKIVLWTQTKHNPKRQMILFDTSDVADFTVFSISEIDDNMINDEIQYWKDSLTLSYNASEAYKLAKYMKTVSVKKNNIDDARALVEEALTKDPYLWQTMNLRKSEFFKSCVKGILKDNLKQAKSGYTTIQKLYPFADILRKNAEKSDNESFETFKQKILGMSADFATQAMKQNLIEFNAFQKKLIENDETGIINYVDNAYSLALQSLETFNNYSVTSINQVEIAEFYCRISLQMLQKAKLKGAFVDSKINEIAEDLFLAGILAEY